MQAVLWAGILDLSFSNSWSLLSILFSLCTSLMLFRRRTQFAGLTVSVPYLWLMISIIAMGVTECAMFLKSPTATGNWASPIRFVAAMTTFCPVMALLGAKRPQDKAWHFVVISLFGILILPALETVFVKRSNEILISDTRRIFVLALILIGLLNTLPTRFRISGALFSSAQLGVVADYLGLTPVKLEGFAVASSLAMTFVAVGLVYLNIPRRRPNVSLPEDQLWLDFRDMLGAMWGLRVVERINACARMYDWKIQLRWNGFVISSEDGRIPAALHRDVRRIMSTLLRRFVSGEWIARRLNGKSSQNQGQTDTQIDADYC